MFQSLPHGQEKTISLFSQEAPVTGMLPSSVPTCNSAHPGWAPSTQFLRAWICTFASHHLPPHPPVICAAHPGKLSP